MRTADVLIEQARLRFVGQQSSSVTGQIWGSDSGGMLPRAGVVRYLPAAETGGAQPTEVSASNLPLPLRLLRWPTSVARPRAAHEAPWKLPSMRIVLQRFDTVHKDMTVAVCTLH